MGSVKNHNGPNKMKKGFIALGYHYLRPDQKLELFPKIYGLKLDEFLNHIKMIKDKYEIISPEDVKRYYYSKFNLVNHKYSLLFTFDDGLSEHYTAANILAEHGIKAFFFIPSCIVKDRLPANPMIMHYCLATYGIEVFLEKYKNSLEEHNIDVDKFAIQFTVGIDDPWKTIMKIKSLLSYGFDYRTSRKLILHIYENSLLNDYCNAVELIHLTKEQISEMLKMGHSIGTHSHSHISIASTVLSKEDFIVEMINPKEYLESKFNTNIFAFSYPFGEEQDCLSSEELKHLTDLYELGFTVTKKVNTKHVSPLELGRVAPDSRTDYIKLGNILETIN